MPQPDESAYPPWATQEGVPSGSRAPAWLSCHASCPLDTPGGSAPRPDGCLSTSSSSPSPASSRPRPMSSQARGVPQDPNTVHWDGLCSERAGHTAGGWVGPSGRHTAPGEAEPACDAHDVLGHDPWCSAAASWPPARSPPPPPPRLRAHRRGHHWSWPSAHRGAAAAPGLHPRVPREARARASPGRAHPPEQRPG
jgi:hypothetical protein